MTIPSYSLPRANRQVLLVERPQGVPLPEHFDFVMAPVESPPEDHVLVRNLYLSVDPAQRGWAADLTNYSAPVELGSVMRALGVGIVVESRLAGIASGDILYGWTGWQDYCVLAASQILSSTRDPDLPVSAYAGVLGINGMTAWLAFTRLGRPSPGELLLVSTAAGAVGSLVGQIARSHGCRAFGLTGSGAKVAACVGRFGYEAAFNYKDADWAERLTAEAGQGLDIFFDNVGGEILDTGLRLMAPGGRVIQCGTASVASWSPPPAGLRNEREVLSRRLAWNGFVIFDHRPEFPAAIAHLEAELRAGRLLFEEDIEVGIEQAPDALRRVYAGENMGKKLIFLE